MTAGAKMDMIRRMAKLRIRSVEPPVAEAAPARAAVEILKLMDAMGLLGLEEEIEVLDLETVRSMARRAAEAGIGESAAAALQTSRAPRPEQVVAALDSLRRALEESPAPEFEWRSMTDLFGAEPLSRLVGVSVASLRRYASGERPTPDLVAARLHFLSRITAELRGAYSEVGVRRWLERKRTQLGGRAPSDVLAAHWDPDDPDPQSVATLARSLAGSPAT